MRLLLMLIACAAWTGAVVVPRLCLTRTPLAARPSRSGTAAMGVGTSIIGPLNEWLVSAPYASAFCVTAFKASSADQIAQARERRLYATGVMRRRQEQQLGRAAAASTASQRTASAMEVTATAISCDEISCEEVEVPIWRPSRPAIVWPRTLAFLFYGGLYQAR